MTDVAIPETEVFQRFLAAADDDTVTMSPEQISVDIIARILESQTVDDVLGSAGTTSAEDFLGKPFRLLDVHFNQSSFDGSGPKFYGILTGVDPDGVPVTVACGAKNVIAQAWKLRDMKALPVEVEIRQSERPTAAGYYVMWLERATVSF